MASSPSRVQFIKNTSEKRRLIGNTGCSCGRLGINAITAPATLNWRTSSRGRVASHMNTKRGLSHTARDLLREGWGYRGQGLTPRFPPNPHRVAIPFQINKRLVRGVNAGCIMLPDQHLSRLVFRGRRHISKAASCLSARRIRLRGTCHGSVKGRLSQV